MSNRKITEAPVVESPPESTPFDTEQPENSAVVIVTVPPIMVTKNRRVQRAKAVTPEPESLPSATEITVACRTLLFDYLTDIAGFPPAEAEAAADRAILALTPPAAYTGRHDTKLAGLITLLRRRQGANIAEMIEATGWQAHSVRGALSGTLKRKLGLAVTSEKAEGARIYRLPPEG
jgi:hypothetical protein